MSIKFVVCNKANKMKVNKNYETSTLTVDYKNACSCIRLCGKTSVRQLKLQIAAN